MLKKWLSNQSHFQWGWPDFDPWFFLWSYAPNAVDLDIRFNKYNGNYGKPRERKGVLGIHHYNTYVFNDMLHKRGSFASFINKWPTLLCLTVLCLLALKTAKIDFQLFSHGLMRFRLYYSLLITSYSRDVRKCCLTSTCIYCCIHLKLFFCIMCPTLLHCMASYGQILFWVVVVCEQTQLCLIWIYLGNGIVMNLRMSINQ